MTKRKRRKKIELSTQTPWSRYRDPPKPGSFGGVIQIPQIWFVINSLAVVALQLFLLHSYDTLLFVTHNGC